MRRGLIEHYDRQVPRYTSYPTAPRFHGGVGPGTYRSWLGETPADASLSLYVHIPYCDTLCWFCGCYTRIVRRYEPIARYLKALEAEIGTVSEALDGRGRVIHMAWGGGSPTMLSPGDIEALAGLMKDSFAFAPDAEFAVEIDPRDLTADKVAALSRAGVNRVSMGVQDVNPEVQEAINRIQPTALTMAAVERLRAAGIRHINVDLIYGLPKQTVECVIRTVDHAVELDARRVAVFGYAHVPWMKRHQRLIDEAALPGAVERFEQCEAAAHRLMDQGYVAIGLDHFARADDPLAIASREGRLHRNFQGYTTDSAEILIGLGASAIGTLPQGYVQNAAPVRSWSEAVRGGGLATARGVEIGADDRLRREVIERLMCDRAVDLADIAARHGLTGDHFAGEIARLAPLAADGLVIVEGGMVRVPDGARPFLRTVCAVFDAHLPTGETRHARAV
jgi:oxygen-independent coproporphyrinogen-3 oxidase